MWRHRSIAGSRLGQLFSSAPAIWPLDPIVARGWHRLPLVTVIATLVGVAATVTPRSIRCQPCHDARGNGAGILFQRGNVSTASLPHDTIPGATGAAAVSH